MLQSTSQNEKKKNVVKEENPDYQHFLLFQQIILKIIKFGIVGSRVHVKRDLYGETLPIIESTMC